MAKIAHKYEDQGVVVLGINPCDDRELALEFMEECGFTFPSALDSSDKAKQVSAAYKHCCDPLHYIIDRDGDIALSLPGFDEGYKRILGTLTSLGVDTGVPPPALSLPRKKLRKIKDAAFPQGPMARGSAQISGAARDSTGKPMDQIYIRLRMDDPYVHRATRTDKNGCYLFRRLPPGTYRITMEPLHKDETRDVKQEVTLNSNDHVTVDFVEGKDGNTQTDQ